ncbi:pyridoxamine 5'-phosphate oxidase family protein [Fluviicola sp.]|uniref:pyridoxamine 5'-phosphate oxidase family protein n=1 Tax=Fluviicola sp. TaxID=1917219 RepID=UPI0031DD88B3
MSTENLNNAEAVKKLTELVDKIDIGMVITRSKDDELHIVPLSRQEVDEHGNIWMLISAESNTCKNLIDNKQVDIAYSHVGDYNFLSVSGRGTVSKDQARIDKYWNKTMDAWFEKGKEDSQIRVLMVETTDAHYWDNKTNKLVTFFKVATSAITGAKMDIGREGNLDL